MKDLIKVTPVLYSIAQASQISGLSRATLYRFIKAGDLQTRKVGRRRLVSKITLERFLAEDHASAA
jgi:excisionase family DNA binding protein